MPPAVPVPVHRPVIRVDDVTRVVHDVIIPAAIRIDHVIGINRVLRGGDALRYLDMRDCHVGTHIPMWLLEQTWPKIRFTLPGE